MFNKSKRVILSIVASGAIFSSAIAMDSKVYATVNGDKVTSQDIQMVIRDPRVQFDTLPKETQKRILDKIIEQKLLSADILKTDIVKDEKYLESLRSIKQSLALQIWMQNKHNSLNISDNEAKDFYNKNKSKFQEQSQMKASHILVKTENEANDIIASLKKSKNLKSDFTQMAKDKSVGPSGKNGGELGWFTKEKMVPEFSNAALKLSKGEITTSPVKTQFGYHIIYLDDKKSASTVAFNDVKDKIKENMKQEKLMKELELKALQLKKDAKIEYK
ncbi:MAG: peptidylprolyl isomerase [Campylobacterota bacterium]|nr:peptidylprolyl isomerase [Campylobacterota bacterium]